MSIPVFSEYSLSQAAAHISAALGNRHQIDDVESYIMNGELVACVYVGEALKYLFPDTYLNIKNGKFELVADAREDLMNGIDTVLEQYGPKDFELHHVVILREELDAFLVHTLAASSTSVGMDVKRPQQIQPAQDEALEDALCNAGYDPFNLPSPPPGKAGVRNQMWAALEGTDLFTRASFDHTWKRLKARVRN